MHGVSVPIGKLGYHLPRTLSTAIGSNSRGEPGSFQAEGPQTEPQILRQRIIKHNDQSNDQQNRAGPPRTVFGIGGGAIHTGLSDPVVSARSSTYNSPAIRLNSRSRDDLESNISARAKDPPINKDSPSI